MTAGCQETSTLSGIQACVVSLSTAPEEHSIYSRPFVNQTRVNTPMIILPKDTI